MSKSALSAKGNEPNLKITSYWRTWLDFRQVTGPLLLSNTWHPGEILMTCLPGQIENS